MRCRSAGVYFIGFLLWVLMHLTPGMALASPTLRSKDISRIPRRSLLALDNQALQNKHQPVQGKAAPLVFAEPVKTDLDIVKSDRWKKTDRNQLVWTQRFHSPGAYSINLGFSAYHMPPGGEMYLYTPDLVHVAGPFTASDNQSHGQLWTPLVPGDEVVLEITVPADQLNGLKLNLASVNHAFIPWGIPSVEKSGSCNVDVVCPAGDGWRDQIRSVGAYTISGIETCSGALVNNTAGDLTPYFLTAHHCNVNSGNAASVVVYWNYQNSTCRPPGSAASGEPGDGSLSQFNTGAALVADYEPSDMTLLELLDPIPVDFDIHWAGWDRRPNDFGGVVAIHHPRVEEKRISFEYQSTTTTSYLGNLPLPGGNHIRVEDWDLGTTEGGSSGSPLFSMDRHIVGQLHGGYAACGNDQPDWYGRLSVSWEGGGTPATRLKDWLDPLDAGVQTLPGRDVAPGFVLVAAPASLELCAGNAAQIELSLLPHYGFDEVVQVVVGTVPEGVSVTFDASPVVLPATVDLNVQTVGQATDQHFQLGVSGLSLSATALAEIDVHIVSGQPEIPTLLSPSNGAQDMVSKPELSWQPISGASSYRVELSTDQSFQHTLYSQLVATSSHRLGIGLDQQEDYFWRVIAINACGESAASDIWMFTVGIFSSPGLNIPDANLDGVSDSIRVVSASAVNQLRVYLEIEHTYVGDLVVSLSRPDNALTVELIASSYSCAGDNLNVWFDSQSAEEFESQCSFDTVPAVLGEYRPRGDLSVFDGIPFSGDWVLRVIDEAELDVGRLVSWGLQNRPGGTPIPTNTPTPTDTPLPVVTDTPTPTATPTLLLGDINHDGFVDEKDLLLLMGNWQQGQRPAD